jgi:HK97 family phage major capsid protein
MSWTIVKDLKEKRAQAHAQATELRSIAHKANRDLSADEVTKHDALIAEVESFNTRILREEKAGALDELIENKRSMIGRESTGVLPAKDMKRYSLLRAISRVAKGLPLDGVEAEVNKEMELRAGVPAKGSFYAPRTVSKRALNTSTGSGSIMTTTEDELIDVLRPKLLTSRLGCTILDDLHGQIRIPQKTAAGTTYWVGDGGTPTGSNPTLSQVLFVPHTIAGYTDITRQFAEQSSISAEAMVMDDLTKDIAIGIDIAAFAGTGSSNQPTGILNASGLTIISNGTNGGSPDYAVTTELETAVANANADQGQLSYVTTPNARGYFKVTPRSTSAVAAGFIWGDDNTVNGYNAYASNVLPNNGTKGTGSNLSTMIFGNFNDMVVGMWGNLDVLVDLQDVDIEYRHVASFAAMTDIVTTVS